MHNDAVFSVPSCSFIVRFFAEGEQSVVSLSPTQLQQLVIVFDKVVDRDEEWFTAFRNVFEGLTNLQQRHAYKELFGYDDELVDSMIGVRFTTFATLEITAHFSKLSTTPILKKVLKKVDCQSVEDIRAL